MLPPIFIAWTRSFWLGIVPIVLVLADMALAIGEPGTAGPLAGLIATTFGFSPESAEMVLRGLAAVAGLIIAHQRRGGNRPYTTDPRALK